MKALICVAVGILYLAWIFNDPVPEGFSDPWTLRKQMAIDRLICIILWLPDAMGLYMYEHSIRALQQYTTEDALIPDNMTVTDDIFDGIPVRIYKPKDAQQAELYPALVFYHGGGWVLSSVDFYDNFVINIAKEVKILIVSVEYRLAPEFTFPIPLEDCVTATKYLLTNAKSFRVDPERVAIGGDSAGGNLAAAVSIKLRDEKFVPMPKHQLLIYPILQSIDLSLSSFQENGHGPLLKKTSVAFATSLYAMGSNKYISSMMKNKHFDPEERKRIFNTQNQHETSDRKSDPDSVPGNDLQKIISNPYFSPLLAKDLTGLPNTYVFTAQYDVLRDEGVLFVKRLRDAGMRVTHVHGNYSIHEICSFPFYKEGRECMRSLTGYIKDNV